MEMKLVGILLGLSQTLLAQTIWTVPAGAPLEPTIALAAPGDILQLGQSHPTFVLDKGLVVLGPSEIFDFSGTTSLQIPAGQSAHLVDLNFPPDYSTSTPAGSTVRVAGNATLEDCQIFGSAAPIYSALDILSGSVALLRCELQAAAFGAEAMHVSSGIVTMSDCELTGLSASLGSGPIGGNLSGEAMRVLGGTVVASACELRGGRGANAAGYGHPSPALVNTGGSVFLSDCVVEAGIPAFQSTGVAPILGAARVARSTLGGSPSLGVVIDDSMVGMNIDAPLRLGLTATATATAGDQLQLLAIVGGFEFSAATYAPFVEPLFGQPAQLVVLTLALPAAGATVSWPLSVPAIPGLIGAGVWLQAIQFDSAEIRASAVVGGVVH